MENTNGLLAEINVDEMHFSLKDTSIFWKGNFANSTELIIEEGITPTRVHSNLPIKLIGRIWVTLGVVSRFRLGSEVDRAISQSEVRDLTNGQ